jgi:hypothetical protein
MSQTVTVTASTPLRYPFLSQPPRQKRRPTGPLPSPPAAGIPVVLPDFGAGNGIGSGIGLGLPSQLCRPPRRSSTISAWAATIQPGTPSPCSPRRRPSLTRSGSRRTSIASVRITSASFLNLTPTSAHAINVDLSASPSKSSFIVDLIPAMPTSPLSAALPMSKQDGEHQAFAIVKMSSDNSNMQPAGTTGRTVKRFRSLSSLRLGGGRRAVSASGVPTFATTTMAPPPVPALPKDLAATTKPIKVKAAPKPKAKKATPQPLALHDEAAFMQLLDGGSMRTNAQRVLTTEGTTAGSGVTAAYKDPRAGLLWRDEDEAWEFARLLDGAITYAYTGGQADWVSFPSPSHTATTRASGMTSLGSLSPGMQPMTPLSATLLALSRVDTAGMMVPVSPESPEFNMATFNVRKAILAMPARPRRQGSDHLREAGFLTTMVGHSTPQPHLQVESRPVAESSSEAVSEPLVMPPTPTTPRTPSSPRFNIPVGISKTRNRRMRRRPAPLALPLPSPLAASFDAPSYPASPAIVVKQHSASKTPVLVRVPLQVQVVSARADRATFFDASFEPVFEHVPMVPTTPAVPPARLGLPANHPLANGGEAGVSKRRGFRGLFTKSGR